MRLFAAVVPPIAVLDEVAAAVGSVPQAEQQSGQPTRRLFRRSSTRDAAGSEAPATPQLQVPDLDKMNIPITSFGNVTLADATTLAAALREQAATWDRAEVRFAGAKALEFAGDQSVWVTLDGDLDHVLAIGRGVPQVVQRLGFFVDRRVFRPWLAVGTITDATTAAYLEQVVDVLESFRGSTWTIEDVALMRRPADATSPDDVEVMELLPLR